MDILTTEEIYANLMQSYRTQTGFDMSDSCELAVRFMAAAAQINSLYIYADWSRKQCFPQTAEGSQLDRHAELRGLERKTAVKAKGTIRFYIPAVLTYNVTVPVGTLCLTSGAVGFVTTAAAVIQAGSLYAEAAAEAVESGAAGNAAAGTVNCISSAPTGVSSCTNPQAFSGGSDREDDDSLRTRIMASCKKMPNGGNAAYYENAALAVEGVAAVTVLPKNRGAGTVDVIISAPGGLPSQALLTKVKSEIDAQREMCVNLRVLAPTSVSVPITATIEAEDGYSAATLCTEVSAALRAWFDGSRLGEDVLRVKLGSIIYGVEGVKNYSITAPAADVDIDSDELPVLGAISITEAV